MTYEKPGMTCNVCRSITRPVWHFMNFMKGHSRAKEMNALTKDDLRFIRTALDHTILKFQEFPYPFEAIRRERIEQARAVQEKIRDLITHER